MREQDQRLLPNQKGNKVSLTVVADNGHMSHHDEKKARAGTPRDCGLAGSPDSNPSASVLRGLVEAFGNAAGSLHVSEHTLAVPRFQEPTLLPEHDRRTSIASRSANAIRAFVARWARERRIRGDIAYYSHLPDWTLRDIGLERGQIEFAVRAAEAERYQDQRAI